jgi:hypothetical protein
VDQEIGELKELVRRNIALSEETNRMVHSMHRSSMWSMVFRVIWWLVILGASAAVYAYLAPYLEQIWKLYDSIGSSEIFNSFPR